MSEEKKIQKKKGQRGQKMNTYFEHLKNTKEFKDEIDRLSLLEKKHSSSHSIEDFELYFNEITSVCEYFQLPSVFWTFAVHNFVISGKWSIDDGYITDVCYLTDFNDVEEKVISSVSSNEFFINYLKDFYKKEFPVFIAVSPYATCKDITDFVESNYTNHILPSLKSYRKKDVVIGKFKKKNETLEARDKYIVENRNISAKKMMSLVKEKFGGKVLSYDYISKIRNKK